MTDITLNELGQAVRDRLKTVHSLADAPGPLQAEARAVTTGAAQPQTPEQAIMLLHRMQRLYLLSGLGMAQRDDAASILDCEKYPLWDRYHAPEASDLHKDKLARLMYEGDPERRHPIKLNIGDYARTIAERVLMRCVADGAEVDPWIDDNLFKRRLLNELNADGARQLGRLLMQSYQTAKRRILIDSTGLPVPFSDPKASAEIEAAFRDGMLEDYASNRTLFYTLTHLPTPEDAELDGMSYQDYMDLYFAMCNVDWDEVDRAHKTLIARLNAGSVLRITNNDGTDVSMDIGGMTFANSRVAKNVPGSEVFSAPKRDSVNGRIVAKGRFMPGYNAQEVIENITLEFADGRLTKYDAETGREFLAKHVETDEGSHWVGEIGIGTNPVLKRHVVNGLLVEKISGSFHVALGNAYVFTEYLGDSVYVNNGNVSKLHWDITTMLHGKQGMMELDGDIIMRDGAFTIPGTEYLNGGCKP